MLVQLSELWCQLEKQSVSLCPKAALILSHAACGSLLWPCHDKVASLAALLLSPIMKYISLLHLSGITLSLVRRIYQEGPHFFCMKRPSSSLSAHTTLPKWKRQRLDPEPSLETSVKYDIRLLQHNQWWSTASPWTQRLESVPLKIKQRSRPITAEVCIESIEFEITFREKRKNSFFSPHDV